MITFGVIGGRSTVAEKTGDYANQEYVDGIMARALSSYGLSFSEAKINLGGGRGTERLAELWADKNRVPKIIIAPRLKYFQELNPETGTDDAFDDRNVRIIGASHTMIIFWDGVTQSTRKAIETSVHMNKLVIVAPMI